MMSLLICGMDTNDIRVRHSDEIRSHSLLLISHMKRGGNTYEVPVSRREGMVLGNASYGESGDERMIKVGKVFGCEVRKRKTLNLSVVEQWMEDMIGRRAGDGGEAKGGWKMVAASGLMTTQLGCGAYRRSQCPDGMYHPQGAHCRKWNPRIKGTGMKVGAS